MARDRGGPALRHQMLIYPVTDTNFETTSYVSNGGGEYFLSTGSMKWFWGHYLGETSPVDASLARVLHTEDLSSLPPATVITAQYDPLKDEGDAYAKRLSEAGIATDHQVADGMIHGFFGMTPAVPDAMKWVNHAGANLRKALA
jgi:acetyl esterase